MRDCECSEYMMERFYAEAVNITDEEQDEDEDEEYNEQDEEYKQDEEYDKDEEQDEQYDWRNDPAHNTPM